MENPSFRRQKQSEKTAFDTLEPIEGFSIEPNLPLSQFPQKLKRLGFQASQLGRACELAKEMKEAGASIFLSCTSNMGSSGIREIIAQLCKEKVVAGIITTTGTIEEDVMKTMHPFRLGKFDVVDEELKEECLNRIGNIYVPDEYYCNFEEWHMKFLQEIHGKQQVISPSEYIRAMGEQLQDEKSILYQAAKNTIPIYCPGLVDGAMGDHMYFFNKKQKESPLVIDVTKDVNLFYDQILAPDKIAGIILGGGIAKHHLIGAAILREGLDYSIYLSTGTQYDGSLSGAHPKEAISWNKLKARENAVMVEADATITFPLVAMSLLQ